ncbi:MAG: hypothetical protein MI757_13805, partial [Pirellulales bacterium]|nr:hypothetical protein [Pirellulales bacterium]
MQLPFHNWTNTFGKLGFRKAKKHDKVARKLRHARRPRLETLEPRQLLAIDFSTATIQSYGAGQDNDNEDQDTASTIDTADTTTLAISGDGWKKVDYSYNVTENTILEFDFSSSDEGEIHAIGLDDDDVISADRSFELFGTQDWGVDTYENYSGSGTQHFVIPVGQFFTGAMDYVTFINDQDFGDQSAQSTFSNVQLYEGEPPALSVNGLPEEAVETYGGESQNPGGSLSVETSDDDGDPNQLDETLTLTGNGWRSIDFAYEVTEDTILEFDFSSTVEGEIHAIGFDTDDTISSDRTFQFFGTQNWGISDFADYTLADETKHYT